MNASIQKQKTYPSRINYVTPLTITTPTLVLPTPSLTTEAMNFKRVHSGKLDFIKHLRPIKTGIPKYLKSLVPVVLNDTYKEADANKNKNITPFTLYDIDSSIKTLNHQPDISKSVIDQAKPIKIPYVNPVKKLHTGIVVANHDHTYTREQVNKLCDTKSIDTQLSNVVSDQQHVKIKNSYHSRKIPSLKENVRYFRPAFEPEKFPIRHHQFSPSLPSQPKDILFEPLKNNKNDSYIIPEISTPIDIKQDDNIIKNNQGKYVTVLRNKDLQSVKTNSLEKTAWKPKFHKHLLLKAPNPYETVLLRALPNTELYSIIHNQIKSQNSASRYSTLDLENILSQMEVETDVNRNLGRSAEKNRATAAGQ